MKALFVGPTLFDLATPGHLLAGTDVVCRAPARQGDIARAALDGAAAIGLVDGRYEDVAAPWHKEILFALSRGVAVYGAASMGALRAAECAPYGMVPVGRVAARYLAGELTDDAAVAQLHGPPELGCVPLTEPLVNVEATIDGARACGAVSGRESELLRSAARRMHFKDRSYRAIVDAAGFAGACAAGLVRRLKDCRRDVKREDALELVATLQAADGPTRTAGWHFCESTAWRRFLEALDPKEADHGG